MGNKNTVIIVVLLFLTFVLIGCYGADGNTSISENVDTGNVIATVSVHLTGAFKPECPGLITAKLQNLGNVKDVQVDTINSLVTVTFKQHVQVGDEYEHEDSMAERQKIANTMKDDLHAVGHGVTGEFVFTNPK